MKLIFISLFLQTIFLHAYQHYANNNVPSVPLPKVAPWFLATATDSDVVGALREGLYDVDSRDQKGYTGLMAACDHIDDSRSRMFLHAGADPNARSREPLTLFNTSLHFVTANINEASMETGVPLLKLLFDNGADPNVRNSEGDIPIHLLRAVDKEENLLPIIHLMITYGVDINARGKDGMTLLHTLGFIRNSRSITALRYHYSFLIDESVKNNEGMTPKVYGASFRFDEVVNAFSTPIFDYSKLTTTTYDPNGFNQIIIASIKGDMLMAQRYKDEKGDINAISRDALKNPAFFYALRYRRPQMISWFINNGIDGSLKNSDGDTMLHVIARTGDERLFDQCLEIIRKKPSLINEKNLHGNTPLHILVKRGAFSFFKRVVLKLKEFIDFSVSNNEGESMRDIALRVHRKQYVSFIDSILREKEKS